MRLTKYSIALFLFLYGIVYADTVYWEGRNNEGGFAVDIPPDWDKDYEIGANGVVFQAKNGNAVLEVRSFVTGEIKSMEELVNLKAARLFSKYSYIFMLHESEDPEGKHTVLWKLKYKGVEYLEKTVLLRNDQRVLILSCLSTLDDYEKNRYVFENAALSIRFTENGVPEDAVQRVYKIEKNKKEFSETPYMPAEEKPSIEAEKEDKTEEIEQNTEREIDINRINQTLSEEEEK